MKPKVFILILNWNGKNDTVECLQSLKKLNYSNYEIVVIDNGSTDTSVQLIKEEYPDINIIYNHKNLGFAEGMNRGIRMIKTRYPELKDYHVLLLNQDVIIEPDFLEKLVEKAEANKETGIVGPKIYYKQEKGESEEILWSCGNEFVSGKAFKMEIPYVTSALVGCWEVDKGQYDNLTYVEALPACCMLIKSKVFEDIGLLDAYFFLLHEDDDFCIRAKKAGYKIRIVPEAIIWHKVSTALINSTKNYASSSTVAYYWHRNWFIVLAKHFNTKIFLKVALSYMLRFIPSEAWRLLWSGWVVFLVIALVIYAGGFAESIRGKPISFIGLASCWLLIVAVYYLKELYNNLTNGKKEIKTSPVMENLSLHQYLLAFIDALKYKLRMRKDNPML